MKRIIAVLVACLSVTTLFSQTLHWNPVSSTTSGSMVLIGKIQINGVDQTSNQLELGVFYGDECRGACIAHLFTYVQPNYYMVDPMVYGDAGNMFTFKLYDHALGQELNLNSPDALAFNENGEGTPFNPYVLNFTGVDYTITASASPSNGGTVSGAGTYQSGSTCTLTATPATGYSFVKWTKNGSQVSTSTSYSFTVTENATYVAVFSLNSYTISVSANPTAGGTVSGGGSYNYGSTCTLTATPATGYSFVKWTKNGSQVSTNASYSFTVTESATYVAVFSQNSYTISASANPSAGGTVSGAGSYNYGSSCTLTATPATGYSFVRWTKNGSQVSTNASYSFTVTENATYVAVFSQNSYTISASANPSAGGTVSGAGSYNYGSSCILTATPATGYSFVKWTKNGSQVSTNASYSFTVTESASYVAVFSQNSYTISASANPTAGGTVSGGGSYNYGSTCTLTATPATGYSFVKWTKNGSQVSTNANYTFTVTESASYVAVFSQNSYTISASANPTAGGTVSGGGSYNYGSSCTLTATANTGYTFNNWTENGEVVSTEASYTFTVNTSRSLVANFTVEGNHWTPVDEGSYPFFMTLYGVIQINGVEQTSNQLELGVFCGDECRGTAIASEFYLTHRYLTEVNVNGDSGQQLTFKLYDHATLQELDLLPPDAITFTISGYGTPVNPYILNFTSPVDITATVDPDGAGTVTGTGEFGIGMFCTLTATANTGFQFLNWTLNSTVVSTSPAYTFTVTEEANYVAHFQHIHTRPLVSGWNWWSTYIEQDGINGLEMLENSLGASGIRIQGKNTSVDYFEYQGTGYWYGALNAIANEQMYLVRTSEACNAAMVGELALPSGHPITINSGWNWIGYPNCQSVEINAAMSGFAPETNDVVKGRSSASIYISYNGYQGWYGQLNTLEPGQGYMYKSNSDTQKTLTFQSGRPGDEAVAANITPEGNVFVPAVASYADNMMVTAVVDMVGEELRSEDYEIAAFVGNQCRGSVKLMYIEPLDRYMALLLAFGEEEEELRFVLTDGRSTSWSDDRISYAANSTVGTVTEPAVLHFGPLGVEDGLQKPVSVYPNPSNGIFNIEGEGIRKIEIVDIYGQVILSNETGSDNLQVDLSDKAVGAYLLRVVTDGGVTTHKLVKNN